MPRFIPTCTRPLLRALGRLAAEHGVNVHSHIHEASTCAVAGLPRLGWACSALPCGRAALHAYIIPS